MFVLFISILNSPFHKTYMTLCPSTSQWKRVETITPSYSQNGLRLDVECYGREGESFLRSSSLLALRWWVNHFRLLEGRASTGGNHYLVILRGTHMWYAPSMRASGLSFLLKRVLLSHKDIGRKGLSAYSRNFCNRCQKEEMKRNLEKSLEKIKMH